VGVMGDSGPPGPPGEPPPSAWPPAPCQPPTLPPPSLSLSISSRSPRATRLREDGSPGPGGTAGHPRCPRPPGSHGAAGQDGALQPGGVPGRHAPGAAPLPAQKRQGPLRLRGAPRPPPLLFILFPRCAGGWGCGFGGVPAGVCTAPSRSGGRVDPARSNTPVWCLLARPPAGSLPGPGAPRPCA